MTDPACVNCGRRHPCGARECDRLRGLSVVIPSKTAANLSACVAAIWKHEAAGLRIIVIDDGLDRAAILPDGQPYNPPGAALIPARLLQMVDGIKPFIFARNCNLGIKAAGDDDVILLNDDALIESPGGFTLLQQAAREHPEYGLISATTDVAGNTAQWRREGGRLRTCPSPTPGNSFATVAFVCVFLPRRTIETVGLMDERFGGVTPEGKRIYGHCDNDFCRRVTLAGLKIGIHDGAFVNHGSLTSTFRGDPNTIDMEAARALYLEKWGCM